ncbi:MAG: aminodeoxychorismate/anthranilate synthase component II [Candidatus Eisenbacteria bacterium]|nr:aminodeoxychorismate/anthranilate synthase component II [Candidatus Eisenbacteria bacterium]
MILVVDNYDSFTYNLVQMIGELGGEPLVFRNDAIPIRRIEELRPAGIVISPGPKSPAETEPSNAILRAFEGRVPILGVCLGHQCLAYVHGGRIVRAQRLMHGKTSMVIHSGRGIFAGLPNPFPATRYHSLLVEKETLPACFEPVAHTAEGELMGMRHREHESWGVQFHPESILTPDGRRLISNFLFLCR